MRFFEVIGRHFVPIGRRDAAIGYRRAPSACVECRMEQRNSKFSYIHPRTGGGTEIAGHR